MYFEMTTMSFPPPTLRLTLRRWGALLALAGLTLPDVAAVRAARAARQEARVESKATVAPATAEPPLPLGEPWEAVVVEPAPPAEPWPAGLVDTDGTPLPSTPPPTTPPVETARAIPVAAPTAPAKAPAKLVPAHREYLRPVLVRYAQENGLPADLVMALAWKESSWRAQVVSKAGAIGVMQLMPNTVVFVCGRLLGLKGRLDPRDPVANIRMATRFLRHLVDRNGASYRQALIAYNQGITALRTRGVYPEAERFADTVLALRVHFRLP